MTHPEQLVFEWLDFRGYIVRCNVRVGRLPGGGHRGEIDIAAYHPESKHCLHVECQCDAGSWKNRKKILEQKFTKGRQFVFKEIFPWLATTDKTQFEQWAVVSSAGKGRDTVGGGKVVTMRQLYRNIAHDVLKLMEAGNRVVPEKYPLLRTIQGSMQHVGGIGKTITGIPEDSLLPTVPTG